MVVPRFVAWSNRLPCALCIGMLSLMGRGAPAQPNDTVRAQYVKSEHRIAMRDGVRLFTAVYTPRDAAPEKTYPILMMRTCYSVSPYGEDAYRDSLGPNRYLQQDGFIFVYQDVRGCYLSEGTFQVLTPHCPDKHGPQDVDESTDTSDTIQWLLDNLPHHNGRVGQWGISYPGFYAAAGMIDAHPALRAVSPQAPIADWWYDDFRHRGALFLPHAFNFTIRFGQPRPQPTTLTPAPLEHVAPDGYQFFLDLGPLSNANTRYLRNRAPLWNMLADHVNYDEFWRRRNLLPHLKRVAPAVLVVGGWFDAEDLYGPLQVYRRIEAENPGIVNCLVMGPWPHGGWSSSRGDHLGDIDFESDTGEHYRRWIETEFFRDFLKGDAPPTWPEAALFETGANRWRQFEQWPPAAGKPRRLYLREDERLEFAPATAAENAWDEFVSDPHKPVPFVEEIAPVISSNYMIDDQRFAARRPDVLVYQTQPLKKNLTLCGPLTADLRVSTSESDADWIVKLIDVFPPDAKNNRFVRSGQQLAGYQMLVRSEVIRGRFRDDPARPTPFIPHEPTRVVLPLQDVLHTFRAGHRLMVQVQSTWFPLVDRNPQKYVDNVFHAAPEDFVKATHRVYRSVDEPSSVTILTLDD